LHYAGVPHAGIAYYPGNAEAIGYIISRLTEMYEILSAEEMVGELQYV
jgi:hypothetical protein